MMFSDLPSSHGGEVIIKIRSPVGYGSYGRWHISELLIQTYTELMDVAFTVFNYFYGMPTGYP